MDQHQKRMAFTDEDDAEMWRFLLKKVRAGDRDAIDHPKGHNIWKKAEQRKLCGGRSFTNLQSRFTRYLRPNLDKCELNLHEINELKTAWRLPIKRSRSPSDDIGKSPNKTRRVVFDDYSSDKDDDDEPTTSRITRPIVVALVHNKSSEEKCKDDPNKEPKMVDARKPHVELNALRQITDLYSSESSPEPEQKEENEAQDSLIVADPLVVNVSQPPNKADVVSDSHNRSHESERNDEADGAFASGRSPKIAERIEEDGVPPQLPPSASGIEKEDNQAKAQETVSERYNFKADEDKEGPEEAAESSTRPENVKLKEKENEPAEIRPPTPVADVATKETERPAPQKEPLSTVRKENESEQPQVNVPHQGQLQENLAPVVQVAAANGDVEFVRAISEVEEEKRRDPALPSEAIEKLQNRGVDATPSTPLVQEATLSDLPAVGSQDFKAAVIRLIREGRLSPSKTTTLIAETTRVIDQSKTRVSNWRATTLSEAQPKM